MKSQYAAFTLLAVSAFCLIGAKFNDFQKQRRHEQIILHVKAQEEAHAKALSLKLEELAAKKEKELAQFKRGLNICIEGANRAAEQYYLETGATKHPPVGKR